MQRLRGLLARSRTARDLRMLGGYQPGTDGQLDQAVALAPLIYDSLRQAPGDPLSENAFSEIAANISTVPPR